MKNLDYRGSQGTTLQLVIFVYLASIALFLYKDLTESFLTTVTIGGPIAYALKESAKAWAEAYRDKNGGKS